MPYTDFHWITDRIAVGSNLLEPDDLPFDVVISMAAHAASPLGPTAFVRAALIRQGTLPRLRY